MNILNNYGWNKYFHESCNTLSQNNFEPGRVISIQGFKYTLITNSGELEAELSGKLLYGSDQEFLPKVGDWVLFIRYDTLGYIVEMLPRMNELHRKAPGAKTEKQVLAANIDYALIVQGLDRDFNLMRLERYLVQIAACNIKPIVVLNKADLVDDIKIFRAEVSKLGRGCPVYFCSTYTLIGIDELKSELKRNLTYMLIGSSGVGKSSLLNALSGDASRVTGNVSESTGKGRHVTTSRDLFQLPNGSLMIDTPGMREFGVAFDEAAYASGLFPLIDQFAWNCRYSDCTHLTEEGCAVLEAYKRGDLEPEVYQSYLKLVKEQKHFALKAEDKKRLGKQFGKMIREVKEFKKRYK